MSNTLKKPFSEFFNQYFRDELGDLPKNTGRVYFLENMDSKNHQKVIDIANKLEIYHSVDVMVDTTITGNKKEGLFIGSSGNITIKPFLEEPIFKNVDDASIRYYEDDNEIRIGSEYVKLIHQESRLFAKRFTQCVKAYKNQDEPAPAPKVTIDTSKSDLDDMDTRMRELEAGLK